MHVDHIYFDKQLSGSEKAQTSLGIPENYGTFWPIFQIFPGIDPLTRHVLAHLRLFGVRPMVKVSMRGDTLPQLHGLFSMISSKGSVVCTIPHAG